MSTTFHTTLATLEDTKELGQVLAKAIMSVWKKGIVIYLEGELGAGKTTLSRYVIQSLGHDGNVKSPTYTLVEPYELAHGYVNHFDLYRLSDPEELEFMGVRDYFQENTLSIIEWPQQGEKHLAPADLIITLQLENVRVASISSHSRNGETILNRCSQTEGYYN